MDPRRLSGKHPGEGCYLLAGFSSRGLYPFQNCNKEDCSLLVAALDRPRFSIDVDESGGRVAIEDGIPEETFSGLEKMGHPVYRVTGYNRSLFGRGQVILRDPETGVLTAGSDPRADGCAIALV